MEGGAENKEFENATPSVGVIMVRNGKVLLVEHLEGASHLTGVWGFPSGRIGDIETEKEAAVREVQEETGLNIREEDLIDFRKGKPYFSEIQRKEGKEKFRFAVYLCHKFKGELRDSKETRPEWIDVDRLPGMNLLPNIIDAISEVRKNL